MMYSKQKAKVQMKIKKIRIRPKEEFFDDLRNVAQALDAGIVPVKPYTGVFFDNLEAVRKILTDKRLDLWRTIRDQEPESISALAKMVGREFKSVHRDLMILKSVELIKFKKIKGKRGDLQTPVSLADQLQFEVA